MTKAHLLSTLLALSLLSGLTSTFAQAGAGGGPPSGAGGAQSPDTKVGTAAKSPGTDAQTQKVVARANAFLATLSPAQRKAAQFAWTDAAQRKLWSNFPTGIVQRKGVKWGELSAAQRSALTALLGAVLSPEGLNMVQLQMEADEVLRRQSGGGGLVFGQAEYYVSFLGSPSATSPWTLQFGGHHLAINATVVGQDITLAPSLTGGQPVRYTVNGKTVYIVEKEVKEALAMLASLSAAQKAKAVISTRNIDLVLGPGQEGKTLQPEGLAGSELSAAQKKQLLALIRSRLGALNADDLAPKMAAIERDLNRTYLAWYGATDGSALFYYRVTAPSAIIEFSPQSMGGDATNHIHSMYRNPVNDYGVSWLK